MFKTKKNNLYLRVTKAQQEEINEKCCDYSFHLYRRARFDPLLKEDVPNLIEIYRQKLVNEALCNNSDNASYDDDVVHSYQYCPWG